MTPANDPGPDAPPRLQPLSAARSLDILIHSACELLVDAEGVARDGGFKLFAEWIGEHIASIEKRLLREVREAIEGLEAEGRQ